MKPSALNAAGITGLAAPLLLLAVLAAAPGPPARATDDGNTADAMSIDMNTTGNSANALGPLDQCARIDHGASGVLDVTVDNVPLYIDNPPFGVIDPGDTGGVLGFSYEFHFPAGMTINAAPDHNFLLNVNPNGSLFNADDATPDNAGPWIATELDIGTGLPESGSGVLTRLSVSVGAAIAQGQYQLQLVNNVIGNPDNTFRFPHVTNVANVAVGQNCGPLVTPDPATPTDTPTPTPTNDGNTPDAMSIDMNTTGNSANALGALDQCARIDQGASGVIDFTVDNLPPYVDNPPLGVMDPSDTGGVQSFSFDFAFPTGVSVAAADVSQMLNVNPGSSIFAASDPTPDANSPWIATALDTGFPSVPESGDGVLARVTLSVGSAVASGQYLLSLNNNATGSSNGNFYFPHTTNSANVAVGQDCGPLVTPAPTPSPTPTPTPTATPTPTPTLANDLFDSAFPFEDPPSSAFQSTFGATQTPGEPSGADCISEIDSSVWYRYIPSVDGTLTVDTLGSNYDTVLVAYIGPELEFIGEIACNDDFGPELTSQVTFSATAGEQYNFLIDGFGSAAGQLQINLTEAPTTPTPTPGPTPLPGEPLFNPGGQVCLESFQWGGPTEIDPGECNGDPSPGAHPDLRVKFCVGYPSGCSGGFVSPRTVRDSNFGGLIGFFPEGATPGSELPIGAIAGRLSSNTVLGILGNPCSTNIAVSFTLLNGSLDMNDTVAPRATGNSNSILPLAADRGEIGQETGTANGIPRGTEKYPSFLRYVFDPDLDFGPDRVPGTGDDISNADGGVDLPPQQPVLRLSGFSMVQNTWVSLQFLVFAPGTFVRGPEGVPVQVDPALGFPVATVLQDPTAPLQPSAISDFCAPLRVQFITFGQTYNNPCTPLPAASKTANCPGGDPEKPIQTRGYPMLPCETLSNIDEDGDGKINDGCPKVNQVSETGADCADDVSNDAEDTDVNDGCPAVGSPEAVFIGGTCSGTDEGGCVARTNLEAGTYPVTVYARSLRDADGDGIETLLDVCFDIPNPNWQPRDFDFANDLDLDGLPVECDPDPNASSPPSEQGCPAGNIGPDEDGDCFNNRGDNCPLNNQLRDPTKPPEYHKPPEGPLPTDNLPELFDDDRDDIGNVCDPEPGVPNGGYATVCLTFPIVIAAGASTAPVLPTESRDPDCAFAPATTPTPTPTPSPAPTPTPSPTPTLGPGFHDGSVERLGSPATVRLLQGAPDTSGGLVTVVVSNESNHTDYVSVYLTYLPPLGGVNPGSCTPSGVVLLGTVLLLAGDRITLRADPPWECSNPTDVDGLTWTLKAIADVHSDDGASCATLPQVFNGQCAVALADDDFDDADSTKTRARPRVDALRP